MTNISSINAYMHMKNIKGLTLIELVVTLAVIAILVAVGVPKLTSTSQSNRLTAVINSLSADFALARSEAVTRKVDVRVTSNNGNDWSQGWVVQALPPAPAAAVTLRTSGALANNILLTGDAATLTYNSDGTQTAGAELKFKTCKNGDATSHGREIQVLASGRIKLVKGKNCP